MNADLKKRAQDNRFIFQSICHGCRAEQVKQVYHLSDMELNERLQLVLRKCNDLRLHRLINCVPGVGVGRPIVCETLGQFYENRKELMRVLDQLPDERIASSVFLPKLTVQDFRSGADFVEIGKELNFKMKHAHGKGIA